MPRVLVRAAPGLSGKSFAFGTAGAPVTFERLFDSIDSGGKLGVAAGETWYALNLPEQGSGEQNAWEACHSLLRQGFGVAGVQSPSFAEPDIAQRWITETPSQSGQSLAQSCADPDKQSGDFPRDDSNPLWFRDSGHSQFDDALKALGWPNVASKVRIAHFDTGYDPDHHALPKHLRTDLAKN